MRYTNITTLNEYNREAQARWNSDYDKKLSQGEQFNLPQLAFYLMKPDAHCGYVAYGENCARWFKTKGQAVNFCNSVFNK